MLNCVLISFLCSCLALDGVFLRELVKEGLPIHDEDIPFLLDLAEDEESVVEIVTHAVGNAR